MQIYIQVISNSPTFNSIPIISQYKWHGGGGAVFFVKLPPPSSINLITNPILRHILQVKTEEVFSVYYTTTALLFNLCMF